MQAAHDSLAAQLAALQQDQATLQPLKEQNAKLHHDVREWSGKAAVAERELRNAATQRDQLKKQLEEAKKHTADPAVAAKLADAEARVAKADQVW